MLDLKDLNSLPYLTLFQMKEQIDKILPAKLADTKAQFCSRIVGEAEALGLDPSEFINVPARTASTRSPAQVKYRNPDRDGETWSGKGRVPRWLKAKLEAGAGIEEFKV